jgi:hypothetical protein
VTHIKRAKRAEQQREWNEIETASIQKLFWKRVKRLTGQKSVVPDSLMVNGEPVSDVNGKAKAMMFYYSQLGKENVKSKGSSQEHISSECNDDGHDHEGFDSHFKKSVVDRVKQLLTQGGSHALLDKPFLMDDVHSALSIVANGKAAGPDHIVYEMIKYGGQHTHQATLSLFNSIWSAEHWPASWQSGLIFSAFKGGDRQLMDDYRGITLLSAISKLFERMINCRLMEWSEKCNILHDEQGGFRPKRGCDHQQFILHEIMSARWYTRTKKLPTYACFIDVKKAYDRVWRTGLWSILHDLGVQGKAWRMLIAMYSSVKRRVVCGNTISDEFSVECGVPQGSVLSPWLYDCYINGLVTQLKSQGYGIDIAGRTVPLLCYADDIVLLSASIVGMKLMLASISQYAHKWRFNYNNKKSNLLVYGSKKYRDEARQHEWLLSGKPLQIVDEYKYLGIEVGKHQTAGKFTTMLDRFESKAKRQIALIISIGCSKGLLMPKTCVTLWNALIRPLFEYGAEIWTCSQTRMNSIESMQCAFGRRVMGIRSSSAGVFIRHELGLPSMQARKDMLVLRWWGRLWSINDDTRLVKVMMFYRWNQIKSNTDTNYDPHSSLVQVRDTLAKYDLQQYWLNGVSKQDQQKWYPLVKRTVQSVQAKHELSCIQQLSSLAMYQNIIKISSKPTLASYLNDTYNRKGTIIKCKLRCNGFALYDVLGSRAIPTWTEVQRACPVCTSGQAENVQHFIAECAAFNTYRNNMLDLMTNVLLPVYGIILASKWIYEATSIQLTHIILGANEYKWDDIIMAKVNKIANNYLLLTDRHRQILLDNVTSNLCPGPSNKPMISPIPLLIQV